MTTTPGFETSSDSGVASPSGPSPVRADAAAGTGDTLPMGGARTGAPAPDPARTAPLGHKLVRLAVLGLPLVALIVVFWLDLVACPFKAMSGIPCPGCGLTRATFSMLAGDLRTALHYNPFVFVLAPTLAFVVLRSMLVGAGFLDRDAWQVRLPKWVWVPCVVLITAVWLARLMGFLGGHPDGVHLERGWVGRLLDWLAML
jgi:hypothetical protein